MAQIVVALLIMALAAPALASAQEGVFVDPDSPAGKEYAIPLEQARREAARGNGESGGRASGQPLFGVGIDRARGAAAGGSDRGETGSGQSGGGEGRSDDPRGPGGSSVPEDVVPDAGSSAAVEAAASEGSDALLTVGVAAAVVAAGLLAGFGLRRLLRSE